VHPLPHAPEKDFGPFPFVVNIEKATVQNPYYRRVLWTGEHLQVTLMNIPPGQDIGLERHPHTDQFLRIEHGEAMVLMGAQEHHLDFRQPAFDGYAIVVPAGTWHNVVNTGTQPLQLYSVYAPPNHAAGVVHTTKEMAEQMERQGEDTPPMYV